MRPCFHCSECGYKKEKYHWRRYQKSSTVEESKAVSRFWSECRTSRSFNKVYCHVIAQSGTIRKNLQTFQLQKVVYLFINILTVKINTSLYFCWISPLIPSSYRKSYNALFFCLELRWDISLSIPSHQLVNNMPRTLMFFQSLGSFLNILSYCFGLDHYRTLQQSPLHVFQKESACYFWLFWSHGI